MRQKKNKFYITTPIYYVNASPHIGHSYTNIAADTLARAMRHSLGEKITGEKVWFLTGSDEHGQKIQRAADEAKMSPQEFVDKVVVQFKALWGELGISNNDFIRTTEERHRRTVERVLSILFARGDIYRSQYEGLYCTPCETFWLESQAAGQICPECKRPVEKIAETSYFFRMSAYQQRLIDHLKASPRFVEPRIRYNEVFSFLTMNTLTDLCISRPKGRLSWGIPLPFDPDHVTYVWFDALINYISAVGTFGEDDQYRSSWWNPETEIVQLIGKDIVRHHAVYWPIMLMALGINLPDTIVAHGWWMIGEDKMSKSRGNAVSPSAVVEKFGIDVYRYFLLRDVPFGTDGNFSEEALVRRFNGDLANDLGNLVYRTLTMVEKYFQGVVPPAGIPAGRAAEIYEKLRLLPGAVSERLSCDGDFNFSAALEKIWEVIAYANKYVEETKPWNLAKENKTEELKSFIRLLVDVIRAASAELEPFMPATAASIKEQLGADTVRKGKPLFPRII
ncbi:MAG: methionine--tRNA ligase [Candidatus Omnitrophota bacterium]